LVVLPAVDFGLRATSAVDASSFSLALAELASVLRKEIQQTSQAGLATLKKAVRQTAASCVTHLLLMMRYPFCVRSGDSYDHMRIAFVGNLVNACFFSIRAHPDHDRVAR